MQLSFKLLLADYTLFEIFNFCTKIQLLFLEQIVDFFGWKTRENVVVLDFWAVDNFDFTRKIVKTIWVKNSWKCWGFSVKFEFLNKNLTFRKVWKYRIRVYFVVKYSIVFIIRIEIGVTDFKERNVILSFSIKVCILESFNFGLVFNLLDIAIPTNVYFVVFISENRPSCVLNGIPCGQGDFNDKKSWEWTIGTDGQRICVTPAVARVSNTMSKPPWAGVYRMSQQVLVKISNLRQIRIWKFFAVKNSSNWWEICTA